MRYANRLRRRDETGAVTGNETVFFKDLKQAGIKEALYQARQDEFRKSAYFLKYLGKVFPEDYMVQFTLAMAQRMSRNRYEAERNFTKALGLLYEDIKDNSFKAIDSDLREPVSLYLAEYLKFLEKQKKDSDYLQTLALSHLILGDGRELETALKEL